MKFLLFLLLAAGGARADYVVQQQLESPASNGTLTYKIKGNLGRVDLPSPMSAGATISMVINATSGEITSIMPEQKILMKMNMGDLRKKGDSTLAAAGVNPGTIRPAPTGQKRKIGAWDAEEYAVSAAGVNMHLWIAKDFPNWKAVREQLARFSQAASAGAPDPNAIDIPGMVVRTDVDSPVGKIVTTLVSVTEQPVADSEFIIPTDYQTMQLPPGLLGK